MGYGDRMRFHEEISDYLNVVLADENSLGTMRSLANDFHIGKLTVSTILANCE